MKKKWACPKCGATALAHGKGGKTACHYDSQDGSCGGFLCECEYDGDMAKHGLVEDNVCECANCSHCGWGGRMPKEAVDPAKLKGWKKKAWDAGWRPR